MWKRQQRESSRQRNRLVFQLHAVLCDLIPGGFAGRITPDALDSVRPTLAAKGIAVALARLTQDLHDVEAYGLADTNWLRAAVPDPADSARVISAVAR